MIAYTMYGQPRYSTSFEVDPAWICQFSRKDLDAYGNQVCALRVRYRTGEPDELRFRDAAEQLRAEDEIRNAWKRGGAT